MNGGSNSSDEVLQDYLDGLLGLDAPAEDKPTSVKLAVAGNIATLPAAPRPARPTSPVRSPTDRPYAEPIRTLNLRMPLPPVAPAPEVVQPVAGIAAPLQVAAPVIEQRASIAPAPAEIAAAPSVAEPVDTAIDDDDLAQMAAPADWFANGRPQWAQQPFECLLFKSGGLTLAAPLVELGSIYPMQADELTSVFGQSSWFMGMLPVKEYNARAIDTARVVMPERYDESMREAYRYLITLFGSDWGLAVDSVVNSVMLDPDSVRWRGQRSKRPWLAGTVVEHMCALLDISQLAWMFHNQDRKRKPPRPA